MINPGSSIVYSEHHKPPVKVSNESIHLSVILLPPTCVGCNSVHLSGSSADGSAAAHPVLGKESDANENELLVKAERHEHSDGGWETPEEESIEGRADSAVYLSPSKSFDVHKPIHETSLGHPSCLTFVKPTQCHLSLLPGSSFVCVERKSGTLVSEISEPVSEWEEYQWNPIIQPSQEEIGDSNGDEVESEEGRSGSAAIILPPRPVYPFYVMPPSQSNDEDGPILALQPILLLPWPVYHPFYMTPPSQPSEDDPILKPVLQPFYSNPEPPFKPFE